MTRQCFDFIFNQQFNVFQMLERHKEQALINLKIMFFEVTY